MESMQQTIFDTVQNAKHKTMRMRIITHRTHRSLSE